MKYFTAKMKYSQIHNKEELEVLKERSTQYKNLSFSFSGKYVESLKNALKEKNAYQMLAIEKNGNFAGYIATSEKELKSNFLWIIELFIEQQYQEQGIGSMLLKHVIEEAKKKNLKGLVTQTEFKNIPAQNLYKKMGFLKIDNPDWQEGETYQLNF